MQVYLLEKKSAITLFPFAFMLIFITYQTRKEFRSISIITINMYSVVFMSEQ